jgi:hypothetical protein
MYAWSLPMPEGRLVNSEPSIQRSTVFKPKVPFVAQVKERHVLGLACALRAAPSPYRASPKQYVLSS